LNNKLDIILAKPIFQKLEFKLSCSKAKSNIFPDILYATDIETLIRAPYNFYAKKILKLRKINEINDRPNLAEFGNFFHSVIEQYTKCYRSDEQNKSLQLIAIAKSTLADNNIPNFSKKIWQIKIAALANEFIKFDEDRRRNIIKVYSEIHGYTTLDIKGKIITIKAIADRIEVGSSGSLSIFDFKTGSIPTKKEILSGLSPQLLVEAIIAFQNGFPIESKLNKDVENPNLLAQAKLAIIYVKIASSSPYIRTNEIILSSQDIAQHKSGLIKLLEYYIDTLEFPIKPNLMKYDDYSHFARRNDNC
jgi:ATP-dependent helicase/nuclease subunit B